LNNKTVINGNYILRLSKCFEKSMGSGKTCPGKGCGNVFLNENVAICGYRSYIKEGG